MQMLVAVWDAVTTKTVANRFWKSKKLSEIQKVAIAKDDDPFNKFKEDVENLQFNRILFQRIWIQLPLPTLMQKF